jgi:hypothetical protein
MRVPSKPFLVKAAAAGLAYVPMLVFFEVCAFHTEGVRNHDFPYYALKGCMIFNFPAVSVLALVKTFHMSRLTLGLWELCLMFAWSSLIAWLFWRIAGALQSQDEPETVQSKFDWIGFQVRFAIGFVLGCLYGRRFVKYTKSMTTLVLASAITGVVAGLAYGFAGREDFWARG